MGSIVLNVCVGLGLVRTRCIANVGRVGNPLSDDIDIGEDRYFSRVK
jgi:hypothetical protein